MADDLELKLKEAIPAATSLSVSVEFVRDGPFGLGAKVPQYHLSASDVSDDITVRSEMERALRAQLGYGTFTSEYDRRSQELTAMYKPLPAIAPQKITISTVSDTGTAVPRRVFASPGSRQ